MSGVSACACPCLCVWVCVGPCVCACKRAIAWSQAGAFSLRTNMRPPVFDTVRTGCFTPGLGTRAGAWHGSFGRVEGRPRGLRMLLVSLTSDAGTGRALLVSVTHDGPCCALFGKVDA